MSRLSMIKSALHDWREEAKLSQTRGDRAEAEQAIDYWEEALRCELRQGRGEPRPEQEWR